MRQSLEKPTNRIHLLKQLPCNNTANGCTDTSACVSQQGSGVGILESTLPSEVYLYPNPFADELHLELGQYYGSIRLVMYDMIGQTIYSQQYNGVDRIDPTMDVTAGTYTLRLEDDRPLRHV